jgi:putative ABC transport system substrate-binding protein
MNRRGFITLLGSAAAWPFAARAQQPALPVIGYLNALGRNDRPYLVDAFRHGLGETGYAEGRNVAIEYRFAENQPDRLPALAADLVGRKPAVIAATGGPNAVLAARERTITIPIVFTLGGNDPVEQGFVASLNRPGGNITGVAIFNAVLVAKRLGLLRDTVPGATVIALLLNPKNPNFGEIQSAQEAARALGLQLLLLNASTPGEIDLALAMLRARADALAVSDPFFVARRQQIVALAMRDRIPVVSSSPEFVAEGALMSYGNDALDLYRRAGLYAGRILKGEKPADLPVDLATKFEFVLNLKTAKTLGLTIPAGVLAIADEVIE